MTSYDRSRFDELRRTEYSRLDEQDHVYLDYTGGGLYAGSQIRTHAEQLGRGIFGNPHSASLASSTSTTLVEEARQAVLDFFHAGDHYAAIFTLNASGGLKHVGESYAFTPGSRFLLTVDNHNSVNGIRELAAGHGADVEYAPLTVPELRLNRAAMLARLDRIDSHHANLFAFPAQSNFSGVKHPLSLVDEAKARGWDVLLDAAAFVPTNPLDLRSVTPDFVVVSFYKMFGYPTGVGCLLVRDTVWPRLRRPWFAGGTVNFASVQGRTHILSAGEAGFEDGTLNYLSLPAVTTGLRHLQAIGMEAIQTHVRTLTDRLLTQLLSLSHSNGRPMVRLYGPATTHERGATVSLNCYDPEGHLLDYRRVEELAGAERISLRTGCFCNPGAGEVAEGLTEDDMRAAAESGIDMTLPRFLRFMQGRGGKSAGAIRVSLGIASHERDLDRFVSFLQSLRDQSHLALGQVTFDIASCRIIRDGS